jgi:hypothetical protein
MTRWQQDNKVATRDPAIIEELHSSSAGGHFGVMKTLNKVRERFFWGKTQGSCREMVLSL